MGVCSEPQEPVAVMVREQHKLRDEAYSIEALHRGGYFYSSDEIAVMATERREVADKLRLCVNSTRRKNA